MLSLACRLKPNVKSVAAKVVDGEAIMINLTNGTYYSMDNVGGWLWQFVEDGRSLEEMIAAIGARYEVRPEQAQADLWLLAERLVEEDLVVVDGETASLARDLPNGGPHKMAYEPPKLNTYRDMAELLALDPPVPGLSDAFWDDASETSPGDPSS